MATMYYLLLGVFLAAVCPAVGAGDAAVVELVKAQMRKAVKMQIREVVNSQMRGFAKTRISGCTYSQICKSAPYVGANDLRPHGNAKYLRALRSPSGHSLWDEGGVGCDTIAHLATSSMQSRTSWELANQQISDLTNKQIGESAHPQHRNTIIAIAVAELGVREATGRNDGHRVEEYLRYTGLGKGHPWCAAFVSWCFGRAGLPQPRNPWSPALFPKARTYYRNGKFVDLQRRESANPRIRE